MQIKTLKTLKRLKKSGLWMYRTSDHGVSHDGFRWKPVGEWTKAPDWSPQPVCGGGLHGQGPGGFGHCQPGARHELCETSPTRVVGGGDKIKTDKAMILCVDQEAWDAIIFLCDGHFPGSVNLAGCAFNLPGLKSIGGDADLRDCKAKLPELQSIGGYAWLGGCEANLPGLKSIGWYAWLEGYELSETVHVAGEIIP